VTHLRVGTRGSELALWQTRWVCDRLREKHASIEIEEIIIKTHGDTAADQSLGGDWPVGAFVSAIEKALLGDAIDFAVHSHKDLQTAATAGLTVAAIPAREDAHDVLLTRAPFTIANVPDGFRVATGSPRRAAQIRRLGRVEIVPIRGNVPTRIAKLTREDLDGLVLAAAGLKRLGIKHPHETALPTDRFVPSPAQGALAVQARDDGTAAQLLACLDHEPSRRAVAAERSFLATINAGCHTPVGALAAIDGASVSLYAQLFSDDGSRLAEGREAGTDPAEVGKRLADRLMRRLAATQ